MASQVEIEKAVELLKDEGYCVKLKKPTIFVGDVLVHARTGKEMVVLEELPGGSLRVVLIPESETCT